MGRGSKVVIAVLGWLNRPVNPRLLRLWVWLTLSVLLLPVSGWFALPLAPLAIHVVVGFKLTPKRETRQAYFAPSLLLLPLCLALWIRSHQVMSYYLLSIGGNEFVGVYVFPGVIEVGWYEHDPAGIKYLEQGVTPEIADVMTDDVRRFQAFDGSDQVFDFFTVVPMYSRTVPIVNGWFAAGTIYAGLVPGPWTPGAFYWHTGPWAWGSGFRTTHFGFHFLAPTLLASVFFVRRVRYWRIHERRLREGFCADCGYDLTGNESDVCSECGAKVPTP